MSAAEPAAPGPTPGVERLEVLDVLRGFALFGVFLVNVFYMALPVGLVDAAPPADAPASEAVVQGVVRAFFETKFVAIFSLLFGIGLVLQMERTEARGGSFAPLYLRRLAVLALMGLLHGFLLWAGDILLLYAVVGLLLLVACRLPAPALAAIAAALAGFGALLSTLLLPLDSSTVEPPTPESLQRVREAVAAGDLFLWPEDPAVETVAAREGPLALTLWVRGTTFVLWLTFGWLVSFNWRVAALFCLGAAAMKWRLLDASRRGLHARLAAVGLVAGGGVEVLVAWARYALPDASYPVAAARVAASEAASLLLAAGYVGAVAWLVHAGALRALRRGLAATGRMALTSYLSQSVVANALFLWYGLGWYGRLSRPQLVLIVALVFACQVALSSLWLSRFRMGPAEWVWRSLTYGRRQRLALDR